MLTSFRIMIRPSYLDTRCIDSSPIRRRSLRRRWRFFQGNRIDRLPAYPHRSPRRVELSAHACPESVHSCRAGDRLLHSEPGDRPGANADGYLAFAVFIIFAAILDAVLTFLVFAESHAHYGQFSTTEAFDQRFASYFTAAGIALYRAHRSDHTLTGSFFRNRQTHGIINGTGRTHPAEFTDGQKNYWISPARYACPQNARNECQRCRNGRDSRGRACRNARSTRVRRGAQR